MSKLSRFVLGCSMSLVAASGIVLSADPAPTTHPATASAPQNNDRFFLSFAQIWRSAQEPEGFSIADFGRETCSTPSLHTAET